MENDGKFGKIHVYYGYGPGKSSAMFGRIVRALGHNLKPALFQFMKVHNKQKEGFYYGEYITLTEVLKIDVFQYGLPHFVDIKKGPSKEDLDMAKKGILDIKDAIEKNKYDIIICDEILTAIQFGIISLSDVIEILKSLPKTIEIMLSGHSEIKEINKLADYVTEMKKIKHPYDSGLPAREGIEY